MGTREKIPDEWDTIGIRHERRNTLILQMARENRPTPGNALDDRLERGGVGLISDAKLAEELLKMGKEHILRKYLPDFKIKQEASAR